MRTPITHASPQHEPERILTNNSLIPDPRVSCFTHCGDFLWRPGEWRLLVPPIQLYRFAEADDRSGDSAAATVGRPQPDRSLEIRHIFAAPAQEAQILDPFDGGTDIAIDSSHCLSAFAGSEVPSSPQLNHMIVLAASSWRSRTIRHSAETLPAG